VKVFIALLLTAICCFGDSYGPKRVIVFKGDSLTLGTGGSAGSNYVSQMFLTTRYGVVVTNLGVSGQNLYEVTNAFDVLQQFTNNNKAGELTAVIMMGVNDNANGQSAATTSTNFIAWGQKIRAAFPYAKIGCITVLAAANGVDNTARTNLNYWITNSGFFDFTIDGASRFTNENDTAIYDADTVHLKDAGYAILAGMVSSNLVQNYRVKDALWPLAPSRTNLWQLGSTVGVVGGIPTVTTIYTNYTSSATAAQIQTGLNNCPSNQVVKLGAGVYTIGSTLTMYRSRGVVLRGTKTNGTNATILDINHDNTLLELGLYSTPGTGVSITNGYTKGSTNIILTSVATFAVGDLVMASQQIDTNYMGSSDGSNTRGVTHTCVVKAKSGNTLTIWPPITFGITYENTPLLHPLNVNSDVAAMSGLEDLIFDATGRTVAWGLFVFNNRDCWVKNVQTKNVNNYHIYTAWCANTEFTQFYANGSPSYAANHSGILVGNGEVAAPGIVELVGTGNTGTAIYDCLFYKVAPGIEVNGGTSGSVFAYNYAYDTQLSTYQGPGIDMNHSAHAMMNLYEGNVVNMLSSDGYFGSSSHDTLLRNWGQGWTQSYPTDQPICLALFAGGRNYSAIGNVWGCTNQTIASAANVNPIPPTTPDFNTPYIHNWGFDTPTFLVYDSGVSNTIVSHGNWDSYNKTQAWITNDHTIPSSYYLTAKPSWFPSDMTWPPVDPANGYTNMHARGNYVIPAMSAYTNNGTWPTNAAGGGGGSSSSYVAPSPRMRRGFP